MVARSLVAGSALVGGFVWVVRWLTGNTADPDLLHWVGLGLVLLAAVGVGAGLVSATNLALRTLVGLCLAALVWALVELVAGPDGTLGLGLCGVVLAVAGLAGMLNARSRGRETPGGARGASRRPAPTPVRRADGAGRRGGRRAR